MRATIYRAGRILWVLACLVTMWSLSATAQTTWEEKNKAGELLFQQGKLADANRLFLDALQEAQRFGPTDLRLAPIYNNLALVAFVRSSFINSEALYEKALAIVEAGRGPEDPLLLPILENLTRLYVKQWAFAKAIHTSRRICSIREKKLGPDNTETIASLNQLATLYLDGVRLLPRTGSEDDAASLATAESLYRRVLAAQEKTFGSTNNRLVDGLQNLGEVQHAQGKLDDAQQSYSRAVSIIEQSFGKEDPKLAAPLQHLADLASEEKGYPEAAALYQRALDIRDKSSGKTDPALVALLTAYAGVMENLQKPDEAAKLSSRAKALTASNQPDTLKPVSQALAVPYVLRFERAVYDRYAGIHQTCMLIRGDGRVRIEDQQSGGHGPVNNQIQRSPDGMGDAPAAQETLGMSGANTQPVKIYETTVDSNALQQLTAILSAKDLRKLQGNYAAADSGNYYGTEKIVVSALREEGVQNFAFPDVHARQPYDETLKPLFKWLSSAEKHRGDVLKQALPNNCTPDPPPPPTQFGPSSRAVLAANAANNPETPTKAALGETASADSPATIKVAVNLVLVRVVVRDAKGNAIGNLRKENFQLLDDRKPRPITRFTVEQSPNSAPETTSTPASNGVKPTPADLATSDRSLAYFFDDAHLSPGNLAQLQSAADRQVSSLLPSAQTAIFTTSGEITLDFTADRTKFREALSRIKSRTTGSHEENNCPNIDPYLADLIWNKHDEDALGAATEEALICAYGNDVRFGAAAEAMARATAQQRFLAAETESRAFLVALQGALRKLAAAPGQRSLILVTPGFVAPGSEADYGRLIDGAIHTDIVISALDARGLYVMDSVASQTRATVDYQREAASAASELMTTLADATGGTVFHNNNDFNLGFDRVAATPASSYVLGFSPAEQEFDGRFHALHVTVSNQDEKLAVQARKGYYAVARSK